MEPKNFGTLLSSDIKLHRTYFKEMTKLLGIQVIYKAPKINIHHNSYGEIDGNYFPGKLIGCIFEEHPTQQTLKKLGWVHELGENSSIIHVPFDLENLQQGALFVIPSAFNPKEGRLFKVIKLSANMIYPASIACEIAPEYENTFQSSEFKYTLGNFTVLADVDD